MKNELESRINDYETSVAFIQPKYQEALNDRGHFEHEIRESLGRETMIKKKHDARVEELTKLKEAKEAADAELAAARTTLATSAIPEVAELEKMRQEAGEMNEKNDRLQKRVTNMQNDLDYMRTNYQNASSSASESASELLSARAEIEILRAKADENRARIHEIQRSNEISELVKRVKQFKAENGELERELEKRGEELKALMNGRRATRGTSVPRSPRMGQGTMSPGPRPIGRVMQMGMGSMAGAMAGAGNNRSRGNSPAPGEFGNRGFGEALFQGQSGTSGRWGNHLQ
jgi:chromosome segregation ATPase